ncbi:MAG: IPExxxVDY family protein [Bacteroidota bacterium]
MPRKLKLDSSLDKDFTLVGIASHHRDYRLIWSMNEKMNLHMVKLVDLKIFNDKKSEIQEYSLYYYNEPQTFKTYYFIANQGEKGMIFPEHRQTNFFLLIKGNVSQEMKNDIVKQIYTIGIILTVHSIPLSSVKNIDNFLSDLELHMLEIQKKEKKKK